MSRIGKAPVIVPKGVEVKIEPNNVVKVKGPKGELFERINPEMKIKLEDGKVLVERPTDQKRHKALHGLYRTLINNMVEGVSKGYEKKLELVGVGFRANARGQNLEISVGYSHPIVIMLPKEIKLTATQEKGQNPTVILQSADKQLLGEVAAKIRSIRPPEPYKGKGIKYSDEHIRRKAGKAAAAAGAGTAAGGGK
ncbi:MAG TPA: 50S ribosomal protein L6 [Chitinophagales bacterium]|nr:50S ribosomal protein L6 [Chitinophagales bacterium]